MDHLDDMFNMEEEVLFHHLLNSVSWPKTGQKKIFLADCSAIEDFFVESPHVVMKMIDQKKIINAQTIFFSKGIPKTDTDESTTNEKIYENQNHKKEKGIHQVQRFHLLMILSSMVRMTSWASGLFFFFFWLGSLVRVGWWLRLGEEGAAWGSGWLALLELLSDMGFG